MIEEARKFRPAARCRVCGCITWVSSLARKVRISKANHAPGCTKPTGRLDLIAEVPIDLRMELFKGKLDRPLSDAALMRLEETWRRCRGRSASTSLVKAGPGTEQQSTG